MITQNKPGNMADNKISILFSFGPLSWPLNEERKQNSAENSFKTKKRQDCKSCVQPNSRSWSIYAKSGSWSLWQSIPLTAMQAGFGPGKVSACIPSCRVQLPRRNAGLPRVLAQDGVRTPSEKKFPPQRLDLNFVSVAAESDKANPCLTIIQFTFFSLTSIQIMFDPATLLNTALSI